MSDDIQQALRDLTASTTELAVEVRSTRTEAQSVKQEGRGHGVSRIVEMEGGRAGAAPGRGREAEMNKAGRKRKAGRRPRRALSPR